MTKKHFDALALHLASVRPEESRHRWQWGQCCSAVADTCALSNPRFDRARFLEACETWETCIRDGKLAIRDGKLRTPAWPEGHPVRELAEAIRQMAEADTPAGSLARQLEEREG